MKKKWITKKIKIGMVNMLELFKERKTVSSGLIKNEFISLFYKIPIKKTRKMREDNIKIKWNEIRTIKKYLIHSGQMAIIFKKMPRGTELYCPEFKRRTLQRNFNIFFRCVEQESAWGYRSFLDKISKGILRIGDNIVSISEEEQKVREEEKAIEIVAKS